MSAPTTIRTNTRISADPSSARPSRSAPAHHDTVTEWMHETASLAPTRTRTPVQTVPGIGYVTTGRFVTPALHDQEPPVYPP